MSRSPEPQPEESGKKNANEVVIAVLGNKQFMDGVYQALEDERLGKGVAFKDVKRARGGH